MPILIEKLGRRRHSKFRHCLFGGTKLFDSCPFLLLQGSNSFNPFLGSLGINHFRRDGVVVRTYPWRSDEPGWIRLLLCRLVV